MPHPDTFRDHARHLRSLIAPAPHCPPPSPPGAILIESALSPTPQFLADAMIPAEIRDIQSHRRPAYRGLFLISLLHTAPSFDASKWRPILTASLDAAEWRIPQTAADGAAATRAAFDALALYAIAPDPRIATMFAHLARSARGDGALLTTTPSDNPETHWFHELVLLHALADFAAISGDDDCRRAAFAAADFHQRETQPDHATTQPWGLLAMLWNPDTLPLANQLLHAVQTQHPAGVTGVSALILADTARRLDSLQCRPLPLAKQQAQPK